MGNKKPRAVTRGRNRQQNLEPMSANNTISQLSLSDLERLIDELTRLQKDNLNMQFELAELKVQLREAKNLALIETKFYSGIKKYFSKG